MEEESSKGEIAHLKVAIVKWVQQGQETGVNMPATSHRQCQHTSPHAEIETEVQKILTDSNMRTLK